MFLSLLARSWAEQKRTETDLITPGATTRALRLLSAVFIESGGEIRSAELTEGHVTAQPLICGWNMKTKLRVTRQHMTWGFVCVQPIPGIDVTYHPVRETPWAFGAAQQPCLFLELIWNLKTDDDMSKRFCWNTPHYNSVEAVEIATTLEVYNSCRLYRDLTSHCSDICLPGNSVF